MRTIKFIVNGQHIECTEAISDLVGNTKEYVQAHFTLSSEWDGLIQIAVFTANGKSYPELIDNGVCIVPYKVMMQESFTVGCYAGATTDRLTTDTCTVRVEESVRYQGGSDYVDMYQKMKNKVDELESRINEYEAAVQETMYEHCQHKTHTPDGAHELRIHNGMFQYYDGGWKDSQVAAAEVQGEYSWRVLSLLRFIDQYEVEGQVYPSYLALPEKGDVRSESLADLFTMGWTKIIYAKASDRVYAWKVFLDSSADYGVRVESLYAPQEEARVIVTVEQGKGVPLLIYENTSADGDSVDLATFNFAEISPNSETRLSVVETQTAVLTKQRERFHSDMWKEILIAENRSKTVLSTTEGVIPVGETGVIVSWSEKQQVPFYTSEPFYIIAESDSDIFVEKCTVESFGVDAFVSETVYQTNSAKEKMEMKVGTSGSSILQEEVSIVNKSDIEVKTTILVFQ